MRFLACAVLLLSAAALVNAAVGRNEDDEESQQRYRLFKRSPNPEGRTFSQIFGGMNKGCQQDTVTEVVTHEPDETDYSSYITEQPISSNGPIDSGTHRSSDDDEPEMDMNNDADDDDFEFNADDDDTNMSFENTGLTRRGNNGPLRPSTGNTRMNEYEILRQQDENQRLRKQVAALRRQNARTRQNAQRARVQLMRRNQNKRRQANRRNRNNLRRVSRINRNNRRRQRNNRNRNRIF